MRWNHLLPAVLAIAALTAPASADNRLVTARIFDETAPQCAGQAGCGCAAGCTASCAGGCATSCAGGCRDSCGSGKSKGLLSKARCGKGKSSCDVCGDVCDDCNGARCKGCGRCGKCSQHMINTLNGNSYRCNVCNMPPHYPYDSTKGYYYFRPYNHRHIAEHQQAVARWGGDPRNPYSNEIFNTVYAELDSLQYQTTPSRPEEVSPPTPPMPIPASAKIRRSIGDKISSRSPR